MSDNTVVILLVSGYIIGAFVLLLATAAIVNHIWPSYRKRIMRNAVLNLYSSNNGYKIPYIPVNTRGFSQK